MKKIILQLLILTFAQSIYAGGGGVVIDGGGGGVEINGKIFLSDFYEMGIHEDPIIQTADTDLYLITYLQNARSGIENAPNDALRKVVRKISDIATVDPILAAAVTEALVNMTWNFTDAPLIITDDTELCPVQLPVVQIAVRQGILVNVSKSVFAKMDSNNQAGLLIHEAIHALASSEITSRCQRRRVVGSLYQERFYSGEPYFLESLLKGFPNKFALPEIIYTNFSTEREFHYFKPDFKEQAIWEKNDNVYGKPDPYAAALWGKNPFLFFPYALDESQQILLGSPIGLMFTKACEGFVQIPELVSIRYWEIQVRPRWNDAGEALAQLDWNMSPRNLTLLDREDEVSQSTCSQEDQLFFESLKIWRNKFSIFRAN